MTSGVSAAELARIKDMIKVYVGRAIKLRAGQ